MDNGNKNTQKKNTETSVESSIVRLRGDMSSSEKILEGSRSQETL